MRNDVHLWPLEDQLRYHAARFAYRHRWELCPSKIEVDGQLRALTWAAWFEKRFGLTLEQYHKQVRDHDDANQQTTGEGGQSDPVTR